MYPIDFFDRDELKCKCCGILKIKERAVKRLQVARFIADIPFTINRAASCVKHNAEIKGASKTSSHVFTMDSDACAFDIRCRDSSDRFKMVDALLKAGFTRLGISETFIHVDDDETKPQNVIWTY